MRVLGLISGTSVDGIDGAIVDIQGDGYGLTLQVIGGATLPYPAALQERILATCAGQPLSMAALADLDDAIAHTFAIAAQTLMKTYGAVDLIASHGQTVFHRPPLPGKAKHPLGYSLQLGRGEAIAALTQLPTVSNFRAGDIAAGGEGAPLVSPIDAVLLSHPTRYRCVQNIGGIGNVTALPPWSATTQTPLPAILGWDTGPGNSLIDLAVQHFSQGAQTYDFGGRWAAQGQPYTPLVQRWMTHGYFQQEPPKSTGRETFGWAFWARCRVEAEAEHLSPADTLATLTDFTAASIADSYRRFLPQPPDEVLLCGGGSRNDYLINRLHDYLPDTEIGSTTAAGVPINLKEAIAFAVLGYWRYHQFPGNLPSVTGARQPMLLGDLHAPVIQNWNQGWN